MNVYWNESSNPLSPSSPPLQEVTRRIFDLAGNHLILYTCLKEKKIEFSLRWNIIRKARAYNNNSKRCELCSWEKYFIVYEPEKASLNKRSEIASTCRHSYKFLVKNQAVT